MARDQTAPTSPVEQFAETIRDLQRRVADLERAIGRIIGAPVFATATARNTALPAPRTGMFAYLITPGQLTMYTGSAWVVI